jgi:hypothetical protein
VRTRSRIISCAATVAALASTVAVPDIAAAADYGPNTCLSGFVWRAAFAGDAVCVHPATRTQARADNAAAASRRDPNGAYGPNSCRAPFVWRVARANDLVCVTPATRSQTAADNAAAASRRNSVRLTLARWTRPDTKTCDGDVCSIRPDGATMHRVVVTNINAGTAYVGLYRRSDRRPLWGRRVPVPALPRQPGGRLDVRTNRLVCRGEPNAYFRVKDLTSGRWSVRIPVRTGCYAL